MGFTANEYDQGADPLIVEKADNPSTRWSPLLWHACSFDPTIFLDVMLNLVRNPNINTSWLSRADILHDEQGDQCFGPQQPQGDDLPRMPVFDSFECKRYLIRKLVPRNASRDDPLDQTCLIYQSSLADGEEKTLVVYLPHVSSEEDIPFYHPKVRGIAFLHDWKAVNSQGSISISYLFFPGSALSTRLNRTALGLLSVVSRHGHGRQLGYVKRVQHDVLVPRVPFQDRYAALKQKYARPLIAGWAESTDPRKHVFEDLGIAAFLIELWAEMYADSPFPGFVDIGCGNGLLVYILNQEGYLGWGFDARARKSWQSYNTQVHISADPQDSLKQLVLVPSVVQPEASSSPSASPDAREAIIHDGLFAEGTFIISNHADELTPWTPVLAAISQCPFVMIPCCSHNLTGSKFRAPPPKDATKSISTYSSLVSWVTGLANDCGWEIETEMLRIPSTRNTALVGRKRSAASSSLDSTQIVQKYGGTGGYLANAMKLAKTAPRGH
ncbi:tRNA Um(44) 2'-O-methyltransferase [Phialemonium atrogriseum]|uniref:tRNA (uracil-O(2)-)-methyltransferase n=1 Tax=Phialemonium atrogriseum TaxID=1093897 RepID=A0AAJ0C444_9PEZI|nr:tRNA Um(44) 2'-O-methyltransferase [Phialemonium atrogriseum]KAK1768753.1 tRNA Um(44) 2'-O-methyltransferase [Phialemonium atrogriseum]